MAGLSRETVTMDVDVQPVLSPRLRTDGELLSFDNAMFMLAKESRRASKYHRPMTVMVVAFSDLLSLASVHGVELYESALAFAGAAISSCVEQDFDVVGVLETDRFFVVLPEAHGQKATFVAENIRKMFQATPIEHKRHRIHLKPSIGISCLPIHGRDWKELIAKADLAADTVSQQGGDGFAFGF